MQACRCRALANVSAHSPGKCHDEAGSTGARQVSEQLFLAATARPSESRRIAGRGGWSAGMGELEVHFTISPHIIPNPAPSSHDLVLVVPNVAANRQELRTST